MVVSAVAVRANARTALAVPKPMVIAAVGLAGLAAAGASLTFALRSGGVEAEIGEPLVIASLAAWVTVSYVLCGLIAWWRRPASRFGPLMIAAGFVSFARPPLLDDQRPHLHDRPGARPAAARALPARVPRVSERPAAAAVRAGPRRDRVRDGDRASARPDDVRRLRPAQPARGRSEPGGGHHRAAGSALAVSALLPVRSRRSSLLVRRRAGRPLRRSLALLVDSFALGLVMIAFLFLSAAFGGPAVAEIRWATFATLGLAPLAFLIGLLHARLARSAVGDLLVELRGDPAPADLRDALARALRDPSLTLAYWLPEFDSWADLRRPAGGSCRVRASGRATTLIDRDGARVAALVHDPSLDDEPELLDAVSAAAGIALENGRLHAELRARLDELRGSRARVDRGRPEGAAAARTQPARRRTAAARRAVARARPARRAAARRSRWRGRASNGRGGEIATSLEELRDVARGIHPAVVSGHGLAVALEQLAARAPVPVRLTVELDGRLPEPLEVAAYYVVSESLTNIGKHAQATSATVDDHSTANGRVVVEVVDDGIGGADTERGSGLRGLADRVEALGGRLRVWTPAGGGTRVQGGDPVRVVIAEDSVLLREGLERLLERERASTSSAAARRRRAAAEGAQLVAGRRDRRHPAATDAQRRGPARRARDPRRASLASACSCSRSTSSSGWR